MLIAALVAGLPVVYVWTTDPINAGNVIAYYAQEAGIEDYGSLTLQSSVTAFTGRGKSLGRVSLVKFVPDEYDNLMALYDRASSTNSTLVVVGSTPDNPMSFAFNAGRLTALPQQVRDLFSEHTDPADLDEVVSLMSGIDLSRQVEICFLCKSNGGLVTARAAQEWRSKLSAHVRGIEPLTIELEHYVINPELGAWLEENKRYFIHAPHPELIPRGLLLDGPPGTGKTKGAMAAAHSWGVPLYRVNLGSCLSRWTGDAEANLDMLLDTLDRLAPCVALLDEVEKVFQATDVEGSIGRMLGNLLWWLAEHKSRVLVVQTTNHMDRVPPELYRPGRVDEVFYFDNLRDVSEALDLAAVVWDYFTANNPKNPDGSKTYPAQAKPMPKELREHIAGLASQENGVSHSNVSHAVTKAIKALNLI